MGENLVTQTQIKQYILFIQSEEKSKNTVGKYKRDIMKFAEFMKEKEVSKELVVAYKEELKKKYVPISVNSMLAAVNGLLSFMDCGHFRVKSVKIQRKIFCEESEELSMEEYQRLLGAAKAKGMEQLNLILQTICGTGIRVSELPFITAEAVHKGRTEVKCKGKVRVIFLPRKLQKLLQSYMKRRRIRTGSIFITNRGKPVNRSNIWKGMKGLCEYAQVLPEKVFPHNLRHLFARTYYRLKKDIVRLADVLGHSRIDTTRIYTLTTGKECIDQVSQLGLVGEQWAIIQ